MRQLMAVLWGGALACGDSAKPGPTSGPIGIETAARTYRPGATVSLTITNLSSENLLYSGCFYQLERLGLHGEWHIVYQDENPCPAILTYLEPLASRQTAVTLPDDLSPGPHRARFPSIGASDSDQETFIVAHQFGGSFDIVER